MHYFSHTHNMRWDEEEDEVEGKEEGEWGRRAEVVEAETLMELIWEGEEEAKAWVGSFTLFMLMSAHSQYNPSQWTRGITL